MSDIKWTPKEQMIFIKDQLNMAKSMMKDRSDLSYSYIDNAFKMIKSLDEELEAVRREKLELIEEFQYLHFRINGLDTGMNNFDIQRVLEEIKESKMYKLCYKKPPTQTSEEDNG